MNGVEALVDEAQALGARFTLDGERVKVAAQVPLPAPLLEKLREHKSEVLSLLREGFEPWALREWRRMSTPEWRRILQESIEKNVSKREEYARWMLREVLLDPQYEEPAT